MNARIGLARAQLLRRVREPNTARLLLDPLHVELTYTETGIESAEGKAVARWAMRFWLSRISGRVACDRVTLRAMRLVLILVGALLVSEVAEAQERGHALEPSIAVAGTLSTSDDKESEISGDGWLARLEYNLGATSYIAWKPYAGLLMTSSSDDRDDADPRCRRAVVECEATTQAVLIGSKLRLALPIPWFAPFAEIGLGFSLGYSRTETLQSRRHVNAAFNFPLALGVALGPAHSVELSLPMYQLGGARQLAIGLSLGFRIPIDVGPDDQKARP